MYTKLHNIFLAGTIFNFFSILNIFQFLNNSSTQKQEKEEFFYRLLEYYLRLYYLRLNLCCRFIEHPIRNIFYSYVRGWDDDVYMYVYVTENLRFSLPSTPPSPSRLPTLSVQKTVLYVKRGNSKNSIKFFIK